MIRNILFIMCDQLRFDYLSCAGHPRLKTPHIDALAARGARFVNAYAQSPICGPSRMSFYTGRYPRSHGVAWNGFPLRVGEMTLGDHLAPFGVRTVLCGKTHMAADRAGLARLGLDPDSGVGARVAQCGFEIWDRHDGLYPPGAPPPTTYNDHLRAVGCDGDNPWADWANAAEGDDGEILSGWLMAHVDKPARIAAEDGETPHITNRAIAFIENAGAQPWCLHLSYIKPHWPYIAPPPYHALYGPQDVSPARRDPAEREGAHPVFAAYQQLRFSRAFAREETRARVIPAYMGLIAQIDDCVGRLIAWMDARGLSEETLIVFTSDHGDYLGDHWLGEKELFHEPSVKIPLIIVDPRPEADPTRGRTIDALAEAIDLLPTFVDVYGGPAGADALSHILEGRSLLPLLRGEQPPAWRPAVVSEYDYSMRKARRILNQPVDDCRLTMLFDGRWKYVHAEGFRPMLFDLREDPNEYRDLGGDPAYEAPRARMFDLMGRWNRRHHNRVTMSRAAIANAAGDLAEGVLIGFWDEDELAAARAAGESGN